MLCCSPDSSQVSAGGSHTCAVERGGDIRCWGSNAHGRAPALTSGDFIQVRFPVPIPSAPSRSPMQQDPAHPDPSSPLLRPRAGGGARLDGMDSEASIVCDGRVLDRRRGVCGCGDCEWCGTVLVCFAALLVHRRYPLEAVTRVPWSEEATSDAGETTAEDKLQLSHRATSSR